MDRLVSPEIRLISDHSKESSKPVICNLVFDEMSVRRKIGYKNGQAYRFVNLGFENDDCDKNKVPNNVVFGGLKYHWKTLVA